MFAWHRPSSNEQTQSPLSRLRLQTLTSLHPSLSYSENRLWVYSITPLAALQSWSNQITLMIIEHDLCAVKQSFMLHAGTPKVGLCKHEAVTRLPNVVLALIRPIAALSRCILASGSRHSHQTQLRSRKSKSSSKSSQIDERYHRTLLGAILTREIKRVEKCCDLWHIKSQSIIAVLDFSKLLVLLSNLSTSIQPCTRWHFMENHAWTHEQGMNVSSWPVGSCFFYSFIIPERDTYISHPTYSLLAFDLLLTSQNESSTCLDAFSTLCTLLSIRGNQFRILACILFTFQLISGERLSDVLDRKWSSPYLSVFQAMEHDSPRGSI